MDDLRTRLDRALTERDTAAARLRTLKGGARPQEIRAAAAARDAARAGLGVLDERLTRYRLLSPGESQMIDIIARTGEVLAPGAVALLFVQPETSYVDIFVPTPALVRALVGQEAKVQPDGDPRGFPAQVEPISPTTEYTQRYLLSETDHKDLVNERLQGELALSRVMVANSSVMSRLAALVAWRAPRDVTVLILGRAARVIGSGSPRR